MTEPMTLRELLDAVAKDIARVRAQSACCEDVAAFDDANLLANARTELDDDVYDLILATRRILTAAFDRERAALVALLRKAEKERDDFAARCASWEVKRHAGDDTLTISWRFDGYVLRLARNVDEILGMSFADVAARIRAALTPTPEAT